MDVVALVGAFGAIMVALLAGHGLSRWAPLPQGPGRYESLDGLRGLLAVFVFVSHCAVWFAYTHHEGWHEPQSRLLLHFGKSSVVLFFMVTAFLFFGRLLDARGGAVDWLHLYVSRALRMTPAYLLAMLLMFGVVALATRWEVDGAGSGIVLRGWSDIVESCATWLAFSVLGTPAIDAYMNTPMIVAGVTWSLPFEWAFYFILPILALALRIKATIGSLVIGLCGVIWLGMWQPAALFAWPFVGGMLAAMLVRVPGLARHACGRVAALAVVASLALLVAFCDTAYGLLPWTLLTFAFVVIASGNSLFGLLELRSTRMLGRMAYSLYLMHGIVLYSVLMFVVGADRASTWSAPIHWVAMAGVTALVVGIAFASFRLVEWPAMRSVSKLVRAMRRAAGRLAINASA